MIIGLAAVSVILILGATIIFALSLMVSARLIRPKRKPLTKIHVSNGHEVLLERTPLSEFQGPMGLLTENETRHLPLGPVVRTENEHVARLLRFELTAPTLGRVVADPFGSPEAAGLTVDRIRIQGQQSASGPAWVLRGGKSCSDLWAVHVHGALSGLESTLRLATTFADLGYTSLSVSYRGDPETTPRSASSSLGDSEWEDLEPAVAYAREHGARQILLTGTSLGASIVLSFLARSSSAPMVHKVVLIAPVLNWDTTLQANVRSAGLPALSARVARRILETRISSRLLGLAQPLDFDRIKFDRWTHPHKTAIIFHFTDDPVSPVISSRELRDSAPHLVRLVELPGSTHALEWNANPSGISRELATWLGILK